jgi:peptidyl-prolyl cis-trans isomerase A (cyclophilin A)
MKHFLSKPPVKLAIGSLIVGFFIWLSSSFDSAKVVRPSAPMPPPKPAVHVLCDTTQGPLEIVVHPEWSPLGAERFLQLVKDGFYSGLPLFRCMEHFICQFGAKPFPHTKVYSAIADDPQVGDLHNFKAGYMSFAGSGLNSRKNHVFIALEPVASLGTQSWETPFGYVTDETMAVTVRKFNTSYGEVAPTGQGPDPNLIEAPGGEQYLKEKFLNLDWFISCHVSAPAK